MIKRKLIAASLTFGIVSSEAAVKPNYSIMGTIVLQKALSSARSAWGMRAEINLIQWQDLGKCNGRTTLGAISNYGTGETELKLADGRAVILAPKTISLNENCRFTPRMLQIAVNHEYGHMLTLNPIHSENPKSVMYAQLKNGQAITANDIATALRAKTRSGK